MLPKDIIKALESRSEVVCEQDAILMRRAAIALRVALTDRHREPDDGYEARET